MSVYLPPSVRAVAYYVYAALSAVSVAVAAAFAEAGIPQPLWLHIATAVLGALGTALGLVAASHTPAPSQPVPADPAAPIEDHVEIAPVDDVAPGDDDPDVIPQHAAVVQ